MATSREDKEFWMEFIELYKENPCLWKIECNAFLMQVSSLFLFLSQALWLKVILSTFRGPSGGSCASHLSTNSSVSSLVCESVYLFSSQSWIYFCRVRFLFFCDTMCAPSNLSNNISVFLQRAEGPWLSSHYGALGLTEMWPSGRTESCVGKHLVPQAFSSVGLTVWSERVWGH